MNGSELFPADELVEVVDGEGRVLDIVPRRLMRERNLRHRTVFVVLIDSRGRLVVHRRADWKDVWPGHWDVAFGGVCLVDEPWIEAARRELREEVGVTAPLRELGSGRYEDDTVREIASVFLAISDGPYEFPDGEVTEHALVPIDDLRVWVGGRRCCPDSMAIVVPLLERMDSKP
ncbi:MAG: hypothetical protein KatS3mg008_1489 [Acidimicrobiales bacterium]|nr:MAG: hypothetical protein KatS3mg008_1489 [Acidimicrobiales bacterium]